MIRVLVPSSVTTSPLQDQLVVRRKLYTIFHALTIPFCNSAAQLMD